jgi:tetratricopeptide (TPR) repeat protein
MIRRLALLTLAAALLLPPAAQANDWEEGVAAFRAGNHARAAEIFQSLVEQRSDCAPCHLMYGNSLLALNRPGDAVTQLRKAYDLNPSDAAVWLPLARAYLGARRHQDALRLLESIDLSALPQNRHQTYYQLRATALDRAGQGDRALDDLRRAAQANPNDAAAQFAYGSQALAAQDTDVAIPALEAAVRLDGRDPAKRRALVRAHLLKGRQTPSGPAKVRAYEKAVEAAQPLVASSAGHANLMFLGEAQLGARQYAGAITTFERAHRANQEDWLALFYLGQARTAQNQLQQAETDLKAALARARGSQDQTRVWRQLGFIYEKQRNYDEARTAYSRIGDQNAVARVEERQQIERENLEIEDYNRRVEELERQRRELEAQMEELPPQR